MYCVMLEKIKIIFHIVLIFVLSMFIVLMVKYAKEFSEGRFLADLGDKTNSAITSKEEIKEPSESQIKAFTEVVKEDMDLLKAYKDYNSDVAAVLRIDDTVLNHPVVQTPDKEDYYLYRDLDKKNNPHGVPFLSADSDLGKSGTNSIIYGHNINILTRDVFADLIYYEQPSYHKEHPVVETVTSEGTTRWFIFAFLKVNLNQPDTFPYTKYVNMTENDFYVFRDSISELNYLDTTMPLDFGDTFLTLSTCANEADTRIVVIGKKIVYDEVVDKYFQ